MNLKEQIYRDFVTAFKAISSNPEEAKRKNFLGVIKGEIQLAESRPNYKGDQSIFGILNKMMKSLKEVDTDEARQEMEWIKVYLPTLMGEDEIRTIVEGLVSGGANNIGQIMGTFNKEYSGKADNKIVSQIARELLATA